MMTRTGEFSVTDLTAITTPFGLLDRETQEALKAHGGPYERFNALGDWCEWTPDWLPSTTYRVKPAPPKPREWWLLLDLWGNERGTDPVVAGPPPNWAPDRTIRVREVLPE